MASEDLHYKRSKFSTRLRENRLYTAGHSWLEQQEEEDLWRIGFTKFALRMLGEIVEMDFEVKPGARIETGQVIGWLEGFKAVSDIFSPIPGAFVGHNPDLDTEINLLNSDPSRRGWLFQVRGKPGEDCLDVNAYVAVLDTTIDKMLGKRHESP